MKRILRSITVAIVLGAGVGCTAMVVEKAVPGSTPNGFRVPGKALLMFIGTNSAGKLGAQFGCVEVDEGAYDVRPVALFAKMDFHIDFDECGVKSFDSKQDTTFPVSLFEKALPLLSGGTGGKVVSAPSAAELDIGYAPGVYRLGKDLQWHLLKVPEIALKECKSSSECASGEFCDTTPKCPDGKVAGVCMTKPTGCTMEFSPVMGCDGNTYSNRCGASAKGQSISGAAELR